MGDCDDFYAQIDPNPSELVVAIVSGTNGTNAGGGFPQVLNWQPGEIHHLALTWGSGVYTLFYLDGVQMSLGGSASYGPYVPASCMGSSTPPLLFTASRQLTAGNSYSPGPFVFDEFALLDRPLTAAEVAQAYNSMEPLQFGTPPSISSLTVTPDVLWPPNHKMVSVTLTATVSDSSDPSPVCGISNITSSEPVSTAPGWVITGPLTLQVRAERAGNGPGRTYTITFTCTNAQNLSASQAVTVTVPHDQQ